MSSNFICRHCGELLNVYIMKTKFYKQYRKIELLFPVDVDLVFGSSPNTVYLHKRD